MMIVYYFFVQLPISVKYHGNSALCAAVYCVHTDMFLQNCNAPK